jgi:hypothetical protein
MVGNRPVIGVRNPVRSASPSSYLRAKNAAAFCNKAKSTTSPQPTSHLLQKSEPSLAAGGGIPILNEKKH